MDIVIVEDELLLADELQEKLELINSEFRVVAKLYSVEEAVEWFSLNDCDLVFMDIHLSDGISFSIFDKVKVKVPVIFATAYDHYTMQAFDVNGIAYILKPVETEDIEKAISKYESLRESYQKNIEGFISDVTDTEDTKYKNQLLLSQGPSKILVDVSDIIYFYAEDRYVFSVIESGKRLFCNYTLRDLEDILDLVLFFRINRAFIVNKNNIVGWESSSKGRIKLILNIESPAILFVSRSRVIEFKEWVQN